MVNVDDERTQKESAPEVAGTGNNPSGRETSGEGRAHPLQG